MMRQWQDEQGYGAAADDYDDDDDDESNNKIDEAGGDYNINIEAVVNLAAISDSVYGMCKS